MANLSTPLGVSFLGNNDNSNTLKPEQQQDIQTLVNIKNKESTEEEDDLDMAPHSAAPIHRSSSRPQLDLSGAAIQGNFEEKDPTILLPNQSDDISHLALDIGGLFLGFFFTSRIYLFDCSILIQEVGFISNHLLHDFFGI